MSDPLPVTTDSQFSDFASLVNRSFVDFRIVLASYTGRSFTLKPKAIKELVIEDKIHNFYASGYIVLDDSFSAIERSDDDNANTSNPTYYNVGLKSSKKGGYLFHGDSVDTISMKILPKLTNSTFSNTDDEIIKKNFLLNYTFTIYNIEEIPSTAVNEKWKKIYFWDIYYDVLRQKSSYFSTADLTDSDNITNTSDIERGTTTGNALSSLLVKSLEPIFKDEFKIGEFDLGQSKIFFSAPNQFKDIDCINYILNHHVSTQDNNYDHCLLRLDRYPRTFNLVSLKKLFANAVSNKQNASATTGSKIVGGSEFLETYKIAGFANANPDGYNLQFELSYDPTLAPYLGNLGNVKSYTFDEMSGDLSRQILSPRIVHYYNSNNKQFNIDSELNSSEEFSNTFNENYVKPFGNSSVASFIPGKLRDTFQNMQNVYYVSHFDDKFTRLAQGRTQLLYDTLNLSNTVKFRVTGSTHRQPGKFILITREDSVTLNDFDSKILGVYFITNVRHVIDGAEYYNEITAIKPYYLKDIYSSKEVL